MDSGQKVGDIIQSLIVDLNASPDGLIVQRCLEDGAHAFTFKPKSSNDSVVGPIKVFMASSCDRLDTSVVECDTTVVFGVANGSVGQDSLCTTSIQCLVVADVPVITISVDVLADTPLDIADSSTGEPIHVDTHVFDSQRCASKRVCERRTRVHCGIHSVSVNVEGSPKEPDNCC